MLLTMDAALDCTHTANSEPFAMRRTDRGEVSPVLHTQSPPIHMEILGNTVPSEYAHGEADAAEGVPAPRQTLPTRHYRGGGGGGGGGDGDDVGIGGALNDNTFTLVLEDRETGERPPRRAPTRVVESGDGGGGGGGGRYDSTHDAASASARSAPSPNRGIRILDQPALSSSVQGEDWLLGAALDLMRAECAVGDRAVLEAAEAAFGVVSSVPVRSSKHPCDVAMDVLRERVASSKNVDTSVRPSSYQTLTRDMLSSAAQRVAAATASLDEEITRNIIGASRSISNTYQPKREVIASVQAAYKAVLAEGAVQKRYRHDLRRVAARAIHSATITFPAIRADTVLQLQSLSRKVQAEADTRTGDLVALATAFAAEHDGCVTSHTKVTERLKRELAGTPLFDSLSIAGAPPSFAASAAVAHDDTEPLRTLASVSPTRAGSVSGRQTALSAPVAATSVLADDPFARRGLHTLLDVLDDVMRRVRAGDYTDLVEAGSLGRPVMPLRARLNVIQTQVAELVDVADASNLRYEAARHTADRRARAHLHDLCDERNVLLERYMDTLQTARLRFESWLQDQGKRLLDKAQGDVAALHQRVLGSHVRSSKIISSSASLAFLQASLDAVYERTKRLESEQAMRAHLSQHVLDIELVNRLVSECARQRAS